MIYDQLVKGGEVIDPAQDMRGRLDIGIIAGKISAIEKCIPTNQAKNVIDANLKIVTPGLIDLHAHPSEGIVAIGVNPDQFGVNQGVTTLTDAGSLGYANFSAVRRYIVPQNTTDLFWFVHIANTGQAVLPEISSHHDINPNATRQTISENRDIVKGVKFRAVGSIARNMGLEPAKIAKQIASEVGLPLMLHIGACFTDTSDTASRVESYTREVLTLLEQGDIITHVYKPGIGGVISPNGALLPEFKDAVARGALLDVAHGQSSFGVQVAKSAIGQGILPHTISSDVSNVNIGGMIVSLTTVMSKLMALGLNLEQVIEMTTINPAKVLNEEHRRGSLAVGMQADITILELVKRKWFFSDANCDIKLESDRFLAPNLTLKARSNTVEIIPARTCNCNCV
jgi:dihydroorotase